MKVFFGFVAIVFQLTFSEGFQRNVYGTTGVLSNFEDHYTDSSYTDTWTITAPIGYRINVSIVYFPENDSQCPRHIEVKDVLSNKTVPCNDQSSSIYSSERRVLQVIFKPSSSNIDKYFATFQAFRPQNTKGCGDGVSWKWLDGSCYGLFESQGDASEAKKHCKQLQNKASMTTVNTKQENDLLTALLKMENQQAGDAVRVFIGLRYDNSSNMFVHFNKTPVIFTAWATPPFRHGPCVTLHKNGSWSESECQLKVNYYSCEKKVLRRKKPYMECSRGVLQSNIVKKIRASSENADFRAEYAPLHKYSGWVPRSEDSKPWIEVSFESSPFLITAVATKGNRNEGVWVARFSLSFALYDERYVNFTNPRREIVYFEGNRDAYNVAYNKLPYPVIAKTVRLVPEKNQSIGLRMEFYGCPAEEAYANCSQPLGLETSAIHDDFMTSSSHHYNGPPHNARLNIDLDVSRNQFSCWSPSNQDADQWLQIDFRSNRTKVTAIATQGRGDDDAEEWVTKYALSYAEYQDYVFTFYKENKLWKNFNGNSDKATVVKQTLNPAIAVFALRVHPLAWHGYISMRLEVYGCQVNGSYTSWSNWTDCSSWCNGSQNRTRSCTSSDPRDCPGSLFESRRCNIENCFSVWSEWTECNQTCGSGVRNRTRYYLGNTTSQNETCKGRLIVVDECNPCDPWSTCNMTCGIGFKILKNCSSDFNQQCQMHVHECNQTNKPSIANFTSWSDWGECTSTCGGIYYQKRTRSSASNDSRLIYNPEVEAKECVCLWNESCNCMWSNWTDCDAPCGGGVQRRVFNCSFTSLGLVNCSGSINETRICNNFSCPVDGNFTEWSNWTVCTVTCGNGTQQRMRNCTKPPPAHGGQNCSGNATEVRRCGTQPCPVDGNFTEWGNWTICSVTCGNGTQQRMRNCTKPPPAHGGLNCSGNTTEIRNCSQRLCPINGNFTEWSNWTICSVTCGNGTQQRMRSCINPPPAHGGRNCTGNRTETQRCELQPCPVDGNWTSWSEWSYCNRPCGVGYENSTRSCTNPAPKYDGKVCKGPREKSRTCNNFSCPAAEVLVSAHFTNETWTDDLNTLDSDASQKLKGKILKNLRNLYKDYDINVTDIKIDSLSKGSVLSNFTIFYDKMDNLQLVLLEENMQVDGLLSTMPVRHPYFNTTKVPNLSPTILTTKNQTSTSIFLSWKHVPSIHLKGQNRSGYRIFYKEKNANYLPNQLKSVTPDKDKTVVDGLKKWTDYSLRILASTKVGNGIASDPINFRTDEDVPSAPPSNFRLTALSSTAISVEWDHIDPASIHGIFLGYNVSVTNEKSREKKFQLHGTTDIYSLVKNLERYTDYVIEVCGFTSKGCGKTAKVQIRTLEDAPTKPPRNAWAFNLSSNSELKVHWGTPEADGINGELRGYTLLYQIRSTAEREVQDAPVFKRPLSPSTREFTLTNLMSYTVYEIKIAARTNGGLGPFARIYGETCRCPKTFYTNYWFHTPYLNKTTSGQVQGVFSHILRNMITWACADCKNGHGKTVVDFTRDGSGSNADKKSMLEVIANVHHGAQVSFPINGNKYMTRVYGGHPFVPVVESPGVAFLSELYDPVSPAWNMLKSVINMLPFILFSLLLAYLAGVVVWFLDSDAPEGSSFPRPFIKGTSEGMWWSFISMTTVGYGDRSPTRFTSRLFAILWTLYGMVLVSIITSSVTTSLTTLTVESTKKIYGLQIAAIENSSEHRLGILMNGKVNQVRQYHSVKDIHDALVTHEVKGALIDTYVVAMDMKRFTDDSIIVTKLLDRPFGYGITLSMEVASIEYPCRDYLRIHEKEVIALIERSTQQLKKPKKSPSVEKSSGLFDPDSILYRNSVLFVGSALLFAVLCGMVWHFIYKAKHSNNKVTSSQLIQREQRETSRKDLRKFVDEFYISTMRKFQMMKERHRAERLQVYKRLRRERKKETKDETQAEDGDDLNNAFKIALKLIKQ